MKYLHEVVHFHAWNISMYGNNATFAYTMSSILIFRWYERHVQHEQVCYGANEPFNSPSAIYFGNFAIYFICKSEKLKKINAHRLCKHFIRTLRQFKFASNRLRFKFIEATHRARRAVDFCICSRNAFHGTTRLKPGIRVNFFFYK